MLKNPEIVPIRPPILPKEKRNRALKNKKYKPYGADNFSRLEISELAKKRIEGKKKKPGGHHLYFVSGDTVVSKEDFAEGKTPENVKEI